jgi:hypothetical protein
MGQDLSLLAPAAVLVLWTLIVLLWMAATRFPAIAKSGVDLSSSPPGGRGAELEAILPAKTNWKSHNYTHLVEQPTLFYAVVLILFVGGGTTSLTVGLAWAYTGLRVAHSLWQSLVNTIPVRFTLFLLSTICLITLSVLAVMLTLG